MLPRSSCLLSWKLPRSWRSRDWPRERRAPRMNRNVVSHFYLVMQSLLVIQTFIKVLKWRKHTHDECFFSMLGPQRCIFVQQRAVNACNVPTASLSLPSPGAAFYISDSENQSAGGSAGSIWRSLLLRPRWVWCPRWSPSSPGRLSQNLLLTRF